MEFKDRELLNELKERLPVNVKLHLKNLIAFGSRVRGDASPDSDLDVVALIDEVSPEIERCISDTAYQVMWDHDFNPMISLLVFSESKFKNSFRRGFSFYRNVMQEGIQI